MRGRIAREAADHELLAITTIGRLQNVASAAKYLGISTTAIKRSLSVLEKRVDCLLFKRAGAFMTPTPSGEILMRYAQLAFSEIRQTREEFASMVGARNGSFKIRIGALPLSHVHLIPHAVSRLVKDMPETDVTVIDGPYENLLKDLCSGGIDLIVGTFREMPIPNIVSIEKLFDDNLAIVARADHPIFKLKMIGASEVGNAKWVLPRRGVPLREQFQKLLKKNNFSTPMTVIEVDSHTAVRSFLLADDWLAVVSRSQIYYEEKQGLLKAVALFPAVVTRSVGITLRKDYSPTICVQRLIEHMRTVAVEIAGQSA